MHLWTQAHVCMMMVALAKSTYEVAIITLCPGMDYGTSIATSSIFHNLVFSNNNRLIEMDIKFVQCVIADESLWASVSYVVLILIKRQFILGSLVLFYNYYSLEACNLQTYPYIFNVLWISWFSE